MVMFYFSGTGNSKYIAELFCQEMDGACHSIEEDIDFEALIEASEVIGFCYPIYASRVPRIMRNFAVRHMDQLEGKKLVIFCTQVLFSGDGARVFTDLFPREHIEVIYAEHFLMPTNVSNLLIWPVPGDRGIKKYMVRAQRKMQSVCRDIKDGRAKRRGFHIGSRMLGLMQGVGFPVLEKRANQSLKIRSNCTNCQICVELCPMQNLIYEDGRMGHRHDCTICYRCVNQCPQKAITVGYHGKVRGQYRGI